MKTIIQKSLFVSPYSILQQRELSIISNVSVAVQLLDAKQIDSENMAYIVNYFNKELRSVSDSNAIFGFVCDKMDSAIKREFFLKLNFDLIQYYQLTAKQKAYITNGMSDVFDFNNLGEQILFMKTTKCGYTPFEKEIKKAISDNKFKDFEEEYVEFIKVSKKITKDMIDNYCSLRTLYAMPEHVQEKLYSMKKYKYYVASKNLENKQFVFETERLDKLATAYREIFLSGVGAFKNSKEYMSNNSEFVAYMCNQKLYEGTPEHSRLLFVNCRQSEECLRNLVDKYSNDFCIDYLSKIRGFLNEDAEWFFVESMEEKPVIAASEKVYNNTYNMLSTRGLKAKLTKIHNWAKDNE